MVIRVFNMCDYDSVFELWKNTPGIGMRGLDDSRDGIRKFIYRNPKTSFVAESGNNIAGVVLCGHDGRRGYIYHVCVAQEHRGKSIGRELIANALSALKDEGINKAALVCFKSNEAGNGFWGSLGWEKRDDLNYYNLSLNDENI